MNCRRKACRPFDTWRPDALDRRPPGYGHVLSPNLPRVRGNHLGCPSCICSFCRRWARFDMDRLDDGLVFHTQPLFPLGPYRRNRFRRYRGSLRNPLSLDNARVLFLWPGESRCPPLEKTLIMRLFESVLYYRLPDAFFTFLYYFFGAIIFMTFFFHPPRLRKPPRMRGAKRRCKKILSPR